MIIQAALILTVLLLLVMFLRHHGKSKTAASVKIAFALLMLLGAIAVLFPGLMSDIAHAINVGRGTDLLLYALVVAFGFASVNTYLRFKDMSARYATLVRAVALQNAEKPDDHVDRP